MHGAVTSVKTASLRPKNRQRPGKDILTARYYGADQMGHPVLLRGNATVDWRQLSRQLAAAGLVSWGPVTPGRLIVVRRPNPANLKRRRAPEFFGTAHFSLFEGASQG